MTLYTNPKRLNNDYLSQMLPNNKYRLYNTNIR